MKIFRKAVAARFENRNVWCRIPSYQRVTPGRKGSKLIQDSFVAKISKRKRSQNIELVVYTYSYVARKVFLMQFNVDIYRLITLRNHDS